VACHRGFRLREATTDLCRAAAARPHESVACTILSLHRLSIYRTATPSTRCRVYPVESGAQLRAGGWRCNSKKRDRLSPVSTWRHGREEREVPRTVGDALGRHGIAGELVTSNGCELGLRADGGSARVNVLRADEVVRWRRRGGPDPSVMQTTAALFRYLPPRSRHGAPVGRRRQPGRVDTRVEGSARAPVRRDSLSNRGRGWPDPSHGRRAGDPDPEWNVFPAARAAE